MILYALEYAEAKKTSGVNARSTYEIISCLSEASTSSRSVLDHFIDFCSGVSTESLKTGVPRFSQRFDSWILEKKVFEHFFDRLVVREIRADMRWLMGNVRWWKPRPQSFSERCSLDVSLISSNPLTVRSKDKRPKTFWLRISRFNCILNFRYNRGHNPRKTDVTRKIMNVISFEDKNRQRGSVFCVVSYEWSVPGSTWSRARSKN